jgi:dTDP-4-dehydrorhamnose reductase
MKPKLIVLGAGGQLGADCVRILSNHYQTTGYTHEQLDICNPDQVKKVLANSQPDFIINCSAFTRVDDCETMADHAFQVNAKGPLYLAQGANDIGAKLIHISTDYVFDGKRRIPEGYLEIDPPSPVSVYGKSKLAGEQAIMAETNHFIIIRTSWLFGIYGNNFLKTIYKLAINESIPFLQVINSQYGSFTHTIDLARQIHQLIEKDAQGIFHITGEGYCTWYEGAVYFLKKMEIAKEIKACTEKEFPTKATRPANSILCNQRLIDENINLMPNWQKAIDHFVVLFKEKLMDQKVGSL